MAGKLQKFFLGMLGMKRAGITESGNKILKSGRIMSSDMSWVSPLLRNSPAALNQDVRAERSISAAGGYWLLANRELFDLLDEMYETDEVLGMALDFLVALALSRPRKLSFASKEDEMKPRAKEILEFCQQVLFSKDSDGPNTEDLLWMLAMGSQKHGRSTCETIWVRRADGKIVPERWFHCHPGQFCFDRLGNLHKYTGAGDALPLPETKFVSAKNRCLYDDPWGGGGVLFPMRYRWYIKKKVLVKEANQSGKFNTPFIHVSVPVGTSEVEDVMDDLVEKLESIDDDTAFVTVNGEEVEVHPRHSGSSSGGSNMFDNVIKRSDSYFVRRILGAELNTAAGDKGARSLGEVHERTTLTRVTPVCRVTEGGFNGGVMTPLVRWNFGEDAPIPVLDYDTKPEADAELWIQIIDCAQKNGLEVAVQQAQEVLGVRGISPGDETLKAPEPEQVVIGPDGIAKKLPGGAKVTDTGKPPIGGKLPAKKVIQLPTEKVEKKPVKATDSEDEGLEFSSEDHSLVDDELRQLQSMARRSVGRYVQARLATAFAEEAEKFEETKFDKQSTQFDCSAYTVEELHKWAQENIKTADLHEKGVEADSHMTVLYGLSQKVTYGQVHKAVAGCWWQFLEYGAFGVFELEECDVLYVEMGYNRDLKELREALEKLPYENSYAYTPHVTVAYLKKGKGKKYKDMPCPVMGMFEFNDQLKFSDVDGTMQSITLTGPEVWMNNQETRKELMQGRAGMSAIQAFGGGRPELWYANDIPGELARKFQRDHALANAKRASVYSLKIAMAAEKDSKVALRQAIRSVMQTLRNEHAGVEPMSGRMVGLVDVETKPFEEAAKHSIWSLALLSGATAGEDLRYVREETAKRQNRFMFSEDDPFADLPPEFKDAAEWMAQRGVMSVEEVRELAALMAPQWGIDPEEAERRLRQQTLALAGTADTSATLKIQKLMSKAAGEGMTVQEFLEQVDSALGAGDLPGGMDAYWENVFRTELGNAYGAQQEANEKKPEYRDHLWGHEGWNPNDNRSDPTHAAITGKRFQKDSPAWRALGICPFRYQCRCARFALMAPDPSRSPYTESGNAMSVALAVTKF